VRTLIALALVLGVGAIAPTAHATAPAELQPLLFLLGDWQAGANTGAPGQGSGSCAFHLSLQDRVIVRTNHAEYPPSGGRPSVVHDDLMIIYRAEGGDVRADFYDNEGHVIRYKVTAATAGNVTFLSDPSAPGPRFRLTYKVQEGGAVQGEFAMAPPGAPDAFKNYLSWEMRKQTKAK
jgi:hypothetical protein